MDLRGEIVYLSADDVYIRHVANSFFVQMTFININILRWFSACNIPKVLTEKLGVCWSRCSASRLSLEVCCFYFWWLKSREESKREYRMDRLCSIFKC